MNTFNRFMLSLFIPISVVEEMGRPKTLAGSMIQEPAGGGGTPPSSMFIRIGCVMGPILEAVSTAAAGVESATRPFDDHRCKSAVGGCLARLLKAPGGRELLQKKCSCIKPDGREFF